MPGVPARHVPEQQAVGGRADGRDERFDARIDAGDTLWENNIYYERAFEEFVDYLDHSTLTPAEIRAILDTHPDAVVVDLKLAEGSGFDVLQAAREADSQTPVIVMTAFGTIEDAATDTGKVRGSVGASSPTVGATPSARREARERVRPGVLGPGARRSRRA
mgnify:CR=1 FL=1